MSAGGKERKRKFVGGRGGAGHGGYEKAAGEA